ncbi:MAG: 1-deoxy-D-xylulose-5-phosphate reductoisomerase [Chloroflexota bacterium]|jgi:1-deoxy-D-xylulose-5-phosphate reductoisomerase|nr:1-deoxy-D-xylulose-5-phosphate reductoisomerase [Chloroflexota bacterium]
MNAPTRVAILGATGSIGQQALEVIAANPDRLIVTALSAHSRDEALKRLAATLHVRRVATGGDDLTALATADDVDLVLVATPGIAGLKPTLAALAAGKDVALANKEVLVVGGHLVRAASGGAGKRLRPVDSEHCALWQCLDGVDPARVRRVAITASGGPFRERAAGTFASITAAEALRHPTWRMGPKVTIDSATLTNKGYEVVEAHWLYGIEYDRIEVVLHPESVVHAMVELVDGSVVAQIAEPDMRLPIQYALLWEHRPSPATRFDWTRTRALHFGPVDLERYPCFSHVLATARAGDQGAMVGLSAADEVAVARFLAGEIGFTEIPALLRRGAELGSGAGKAATVEDIVRIDERVRRELQPAGARA